MDAFNNFMDFLGDLKEQQLNMKELKNEFKLPKKNFPKLAKMIQYFKTEFSTRTTNESRTKWHNYDKQLLFWIVCKYCQVNSKYIVASLSKKGQSSMDDNDWNQISQILGVETKILKNKWLVLVKPQVKNAPWTQEEDTILKNLIDSNEKNHNWTQVATQLAEQTQNSSFRNAKQIRERWNNYLNPTLKKSEWEEIEDIQLLENVLIHGKKWSQISQLMGCRTESQVKNRYNSISNRLKKTYGDSYPEETLVQMEINQLKGFTNGTQITILSPTAIKIKREIVSPLMSAMSGESNTKKNNDLSSSDTLQVNLRRHKSSADSIITEQHQSPVYSNQSSPQLSETYYNQEATSFIQLDMNAVTTTVSQNPHHYSIPLPQNYIPNQHFKTQEISDFCAQNVPSIPQNNLQFQEPHQPQYITLNYQQYQTVHQQEIQQHQSNVAHQPSIPSTRGYFYDNYLQVNTPTPANHNNNAGNLYIEDWGFTQMQQNYSAPTPNNNQSHYYTNNVSSAQQTAPANLDFNTAFHSIENNEYIAARRNSTLINDTQKPFNYQTNHHNFFTIPTTPQNQANNVHSFYYEEQY